MSASPAPRAARVEDLRLITGRGRYVTDIVVPDMLHAVFVRSTHAHARLDRVDCAAAAASPGVIAVLCSADLGHPAMPPINPLANGFAGPVCHLMAHGSVTAVGQPIVLVVAASADAANLAAELVEVDYAPLPVEADHAASAAPVTAVRYRAGDMAAAQRDAAHRVSVSQRQPRVSAMALEPRAVLAQWVTETATLTVWLASQSPARARDDIARAAGMPVASVRVISPDVGGAFGARASVHPEELLVALAAQRLKAAVKWTGTRSEEFTSAVQGRGARLAGTLTLDAAGRFTSLTARIDFPLGAWLPFSAAVPARNAARILPGPYCVAALDIQSETRMAHAAAINIYRGAGRPEATLLMECLVDDAARQARIDPVELRRANLIPASAMPWTTPTGEVLDSGDYLAALERACERFGYTHERREQARRRAAGEVVGIGVAMYVEPCGAGWESARVTLQADGRVHVASGSPAQGQGHETSYATVAAAALGCAPGDVTVEQGDTRTCPDGIGALASRSIAIGGSAVHEAASKIAQRRAGGAVLPLTEDIVYHAPGEAWAHGCVIARMAIDRDTGTPTIERIVWVDDAGRVISPQLAEGQLLGGMAQGVGQAMQESIVYDAAGQLLTGSLMDYALPRAGAMPMPEIENLVSPARTNVLGAKGVGEAGCIGVPAALLNAAADALAPLGVETSALQFPLTAPRLWQALRSAS
jgi:carbon-monoxide dehydrogenase large subunit